MPFSFLLGPGKGSPLLRLGMLSFPAPTAQQLAAPSQPSPQVVGSPPLLPFPALPTARTLGMGQDPAPLPKGLCVTLQI